MKSTKTFAVLALAALTALTAVPATAAEYDIDLSHSAVGFQIKHLAISKVNGSFGDFSGTFTYDPANPGATKAEAVIQVASIDTGNEKRDSHLKNPDFFDAEKFPTMTFKSTSVTMKDAENGEIAGDLTMHGVTKPVVLKLEVNGTATDPWGNERVGASLTGSLTRADWGLTYNAAMEAGGLVLGEDVKISIEIEGIKKK
jgi:polyisoprenoid-binding protein YceI